MRKQLLLSTGIICLMLAPGLSYGQAPGGRSEEPKQMQPGAAGKGAASQERGAEQKAQGAMGREERGTGSRQAGERGKAATPGADRPTAASDDSKRGRGEDARPAARAQDARQGGREGKDAKGGAEMKRDSGKSAAETEKSKAGTAASQKEREGTAATQKREREGTTTTQKEPGRDQRGEPSKDAAQQSKDRPGTASETTRTQTQTSQTQSQQSGISTDKQVRISETLTRERLAPPQRNLNVSIRVGERIPRHVRVQRLPAAIISIEPQYRGYDYFTTEEEIVIVEPRTQRIVSQIPRDASRIRAAGGETGSGRAADAMAQAGGAPCRIMSRDTAGNVTEVSPTTVGSTAPQDSISVTVRAPGGGGSTNPIALGASDGQIVVAMQGGDCTVTIEPQTR
ncbi:DUF1236 domain-containing protein [Bradyrhizobium sp. CSA112]|uniref:DUF1236 domain-containing protein n=1 Tax=Bradyrhizobium sp. CSA112 TaxID=2699170 RepID=UPI0023AFBD4A|nr:DUF1236 domain-containing protein [Bradyrhizobium sp. CSA112]MDE5454350.1 DUF1236 domain-containing protein [Bradyrhizobium sp. CSA112]